MNSDATSQTASRARRSSAIWWWALAGLAVGFIAVSGQSLWVDEALTATEVSKSTLAGMWHGLVQDKGSDLQMPLYLLHLWAWVKVFGTSEWALRSVNVLWFVGGLVAWMAAFGKRGGTMAMALPLLFSSFAWYFINEARPYAMQIGSGLMAFAALMAMGCSHYETVSQGSRGRSPSLHAAVSNTVLRTERSWMLIFCLGLVGLSGSSLLGMIWGGGYVLAAIVFISWVRVGGLAKSHWLIAGSSALMLVVLAVYYVWTLKLGARATGGRTDVRNLVFIVYEVLGFGGLGPGRLEIRESTAGSFAPYVGPLLIYGALLAVISWRGAVGIWRGAGRGSLVALMLGIGIPSVVLIGAGYGMEFRVLERHFAPALPLVSWVVGIGVVECWSKGPWCMRAVAVGFVIASVVGCLETRFAARHEKDDYRDAVAMAESALGQGEVVWWNAGWHGAVYYRLPLATNVTGRGALWLPNPTVEELAGLARPEVVVTSKPDMFDARGGLAEFLRKGPYARAAVYPAFEVWRREKAANQPGNKEFD